MKINKTKLNMKGFLIVGILFALFVCPLVFAIGMGCGYSKDVPLKMYPGESKTIILSLENPDVEGVANLKVFLLEGSGVALLKENTYKVPMGEKVAIEMDIGVPSEAVIGNEYLIKYRVEQVSDEEAGGGASFTQGISRGFYVKVVEKPVIPEEPKSEGSNFIWWILGAVVVIVVIVIIIMMMRKKPVKSK